MQVVHQATQSLRTASCPICRLLGAVISAREYFGTKPPYELMLIEKLSIEHIDMSTLRFQLRDRGIRNLAEGPHLLLLHPQPWETELPRDSMMFGDTPIELFKDQLTTCGCEHSQTCVPESPDRLRGLKVLDCLTKDVVPAPPGCRYVALSYVWGGQTGVDSARISRTVADSCVVALELGILFFGLIDT